MKPFPGFPPKRHYTPIPSSFFTLLLPYIDDLWELKITLFVLWLLSQKRGYPRFVSLGEILKDRALLGGLDGEGLRQALGKACQRGTLIPLTLEKDGKRYHLYFLNTPEDKEAKERIERGEIPLGEVVPELEPPPEVKSIFALYEENIGLISPLIAEELKEAEKRYPPSWIEDAFKEAVALNKRSWRYISRILERWARDGKPGGYIKEEKDRKRYIKGRYKHIVGY